MSLTIVGSNIVNKFQQSFDKLITGLHNDQLDNQSHRKSLVKELAPWDASIVRSAIRGLTSAPSAKLAPCIFTRFGSGSLARTDFRVEEGFEESLGRSGGGGGGDKCPSIVPNAKRTKLKLAKRTKTQTLTDAKRRIASWPHSIYIAIWRIVLFLVLLLFSDGEAHRRRRHPTAKQSD